MAKCLVGAAGGLSASDKAKLIPENLRDGVKLFEGTSKEIVGEVKETAMSLACFSGWLDEYQSYVMASWSGSAYLDSGSVGVDTQGSTTKDITVKQAFTGYIEYPQGEYARLSLKKNATEPIGTSPDAPTAFNEGDAIRVSVSYAANLRKIYMARIYTV